MKRNSFEQFEKPSTPPQLYPQNLSEQQSTPEFRDTAELFMEAFDRHYKVATPVDSIRFPLSITSKPENAYERYKNHLGKALFADWRFLVAVDVVKTPGSRTDAVERYDTRLARGHPDVSELVLVVEIVGHWPWRRGERRGMESVEA